jgi:hypothetical protein
MAKKRCKAKRLTAMPEISMLMAGILLWGMVIGCQTTGSTREGLTVPQGNRIMLKPGGPHVGTFATRNMNINYTYHLENSKLRVAGNWDTRYRDIDRLSMTLFYLDEDGTVIDYFPFFTRPRRVVQGRVMDNRFEREFDLPADAAAISIGYTGRSRLGGPEGKGRVFRHSPF